MEFIRARSSTLGRVPHAASRTIAVDNLLLLSSMFYTLLNGSGDKSCGYGAFRETHSVRFFCFPLIKSVADLLLMHCTTSPWLWYVCRQWIDGTKFTSNVGVNTVSAWRTQEPSDKGEKCTLLSYLLYSFSSLSFFAVVYLYIAASFGIVCCTYCHPKSEASFSLVSPSAS